MDISDIIVLGITLTLLVGVNMGVSMGMGI